MAKKKLGSTKLVDEVLVTSVNLASDVTGTLPVTNGGTGQTAFTDGQLLIGNTATGGLSKATLTQGTGVTITNGNGTITIASSSSGTVNAGSINQLAYYAAAGTTISGTSDIPTATTIGTAYIYRVGGNDVSVADGGTGLSSGTQGGILWYSASGTLASTALLTQYAPVVGGGAGTAPHSIAGGVGAANQVLISNGGGSDPSWNLIGPNQIQSVLNNRFASISFTAGAESGNAIPVTGLAANLSGTTIASTETIVELIVSDSATDGEPSATATFSSVTTGQLLAGIGTSTLRVQTAASGSFVVNVSETAVGSRYLWVKQGHGSQTWVRANAAPFTLTFA